MSLQFNVAQLLKTNVGQTREYDFESDLPIDLDGVLASNISGHAKLILTNFGIIATVTARATLHLICARCLEPFQTRAQIAFEEEYRPSIDITTGLPSTIPVGDTAFLISQNHNLDFREAIRQNLLLAVDLIPVCRPDCRGLCPDCGANRNLQECACRPEETSSPFAILEALLGDQEQSGSPSEQKSHVATSTGHPKSHVGDRRANG